MRLTWHPDAWSDYLDWQTRDRKTLRKINELIRDISRNGHDGIGKPEPLKGDLTGWWSRRINNSDRLVYKIEDDICLIAQCKGHYQ